MVRGQRPDISAGAPPAEQQQGSPLERARDIVSTPTYPIGGLHD